MAERGRVGLLDPEQVTRLRAEPFSYVEVGGTAKTLSSRGFRSLSRTVRLPVGAGFEAAGEALLRWQVQLRAGLRVTASAERIQADTVAVLVVGIGPVAVRSPVRVVYLIDEPDRRGFAYGTLSGHPESGEEAFVLQRESDGSVTFTVSAFSRPGSWLTRLTGPAARGAQHVITNRYLRSFGG